MNKIYTYYPARIQDLRIGQIIYKKEGSQLNPLSISREDFLPSPHNPRPNISMLTTEILRHNYNSRGLGLNKDAMYKIRVVTGEDITSRGFNYVSDSSTTKVKLYENRRFEIMFEVLDRIIRIFEKTTGIENPMIFEGQVLNALELEDIFEITGVVYNPDRKALFIKDGK
jgi:hypothetical protein